MNALLAPHRPPSIFIIGDVILDHTIQGSVARVANEAPVPVLRKSQNLERATLGGAANVAANVAACGADTYLYSVVGADLYADCLCKLIPAEIHKTVLYAADHSTIVKHRGFVHNNLLFRYDEGEAGVPTDSLRKLYKIILKDIRRIQPDAIIYSDYGYGVCADPYIRTIIYAARVLGIPTIVDAKGSYERYSGATVIKPNRGEAAAYVGLPKDTDVGALHQRLYEKAVADYTCITMSEDGISLYDHIGGIRTEQAVPQKYTVNDVTGAGDVATAVLAYCFATRTPTHQTLYCVVSLATASVQHMCTYVLQPADFWHVRRGLNKRIRLDELSHIPRTLGPIVFTNGCFDLLHAGHIKQLKYAKEQGATLVVGLNSDKSVALLKGPNRPVIPQEQRAVLIEALECVDYYFLFDDLSPAAYVQQLQPDVLVKGADYSVSQLSSAQYAKRVELCPLYDDVSTSRIIEKISRLNNPKPSL